LSIPKDLPDDPKSEPVVEVSVNDAPEAILSEEKPVEEVENSGDTLTKTSLVTPNFTGMTLRAVLELAGKNGFRIDPSGSGLVRSQIPAAGEPVAYGQKIKLRFGR
jgi:beta-lactam-binding protein with PASTA domain